MAEARLLVRNINRIPKSLIQAKQKSHKLHSQTLKTERSSSTSRKQDFSLITKRASRSTRRLISISTKDGRWDGDWSCDFLLSLKDLRLSDLVEDEHKDAQVSINLRIQKHASFGLSVDGRIITSFTRKCSYCSSPYCRELDTNFNVWVLSSSRGNDAAQLPEIGGDDPSLKVIYVKPGDEAKLDSLIQDTIRLATFTRDTCSESCEKSEPIVQYVGRQNVASVEKRWYRLLELRNTI